MPTLAHQSYTHFTNFTVTQQNTQSKISRLAQSALYYSPEIWYFANHDATRGLDPSRGGNLGYTVEIGKYFDGAGLYCFYWLRHETWKYKSSLK